MTPENYIAAQETESAALLKSIHNIILSQDKKVSASVDKMMGKDMIIYADGGAFRYALASTKKHLTLHLLPMYSSPDIYERYKILLLKAAFQKGCINFKAAEEMPATIVKKLIQDCSKVDMVAIRNKQLQGKK